MFKKVSWGVPAVSILYFGQFNHFHYCPLPFPSHPPLFNNFQYPWLYPLPAQMLYISILLTLYHSLFFPSSPKFHRVVPQRQAKIRESSWFTEKYCMSDWPYSGSDTLTWPRNHPCPSPLRWIHQVDGNHLVPPLPQISASFKSTWRREAHSLPPDSTWAPLCPFCISPP
jgi:hypothetical protein